MNRYRSLAILTVALAGAAFAAPEVALATPGKSAKLCTTCHKTVDEGVVRGHFGDVAWKSKSVSVKVDAEVEVFKFDPADIKTANIPEQGDLEKNLRFVKAGQEVRIAFVEKDGGKVATSLTVKPKLKVPADKVVSTDEMEKLVAIGPKEGNYSLFDSRPFPRFAEGYVPSAVVLPFAAWDNQKGKLPDDKTRLVIFYCQGVS